MALQLKCLPILSVFPLILYKKHFTSLHCLYLSSTEKLKHRLRLHISPPATSFYDKAGQSPPMSTLWTGLLVLECGQQRPIIEATGLQLGLYDHLRPPQMDNTSLPASRRNLNYRRRWIWKWRESRRLIGSLCPSTHKHWITVTNTDTHGALSPIKHAIGLWEMWFQGIICIFCCWIIYFFQQNQNYIVQ